MLHCCCCYWWIEVLYPSRRVSWRHLGSLRCSGWGRNVTKRERERENCIVVLWVWRFAFTDKSIRDSSAPWMLEAFHIEKEREGQRQRKGGREGRVRKLALPQLILREESHSKSMQTCRLNASTLGQHCTVYSLGSKWILLLMWRDMVTSVLCSKSDVLHFFVFPFWTNLPTLPPLTCLSKCTVGIWG